MKGKLLEYIFIILILSPLLFINNKSSHDWGDDFAGYLQEAQNIATGRPFYETRMLSQDYAPSYAPQYYSVGFPLLLAPVIRIFGIDFRVFDCYISLWILLWGVLVFAYLRSRVSFITSSSFVFIFFINPFFFRFKTEVLSDIPFSVFFTLSMVCFIHRQGRSWIHALLSGCVFAFTISIRDLGWFFPSLLMADVLYIVALRIAGLVSLQDLFYRVRLSILTLTSAFVSLIILNVLFFKTPGSQLHHFAGLYASPSHWDTFIFNLDVYTHLFQNLFHHDVGMYTFTLYYASAFMLVLAVVGFSHLLFSPYRSELLLIIGYGLVVLLFPYSSQGFRYLLPVLPVIILCTIYGAKSIALPWQVHKYLAAAVFVLFISFISIREVMAAAKSHDDVIYPGPMTGESRQVLDFIIKTIPDDALIATIKPRAIMFFTGRRTCLIPKNATVPFMLEKLAAVHPDYLLELQDIQVSLVSDLAAARHDSLIWSYQGNRLYQCRR